MKTIYIILTLFTLGSAFSSCNNQAQSASAEQTTSISAVTSLKMRTGPLAEASDWKITQAKFKELADKIAKNPDDVKTKLLLAQLYMQEARITGEHPYYYPATLNILNDVLKKEAANFEALAFKASVELSLHHFKDALATGNRALAINSNNGFVYGVLCDANVELGNYEEAVKMSDMMQTIRPGLEAYSRASYLREIYGRNDGAIEAMKMAYQAGLLGSEEASWAGYTLAHLYENTGKTKEAEDIYMALLQYRPSYSFATNGLARIAKIKGNYKEALKLAEQATTAMPEFSFYEEMADIYNSMNNGEKAKEIYKNVITMLKEDAASGHYADMELALAYLKLGEKDLALKHAHIEYERRPLNIDVNNTLAWVYHQMGSKDKALEHIKVALRMGTQNSVLLSRAAKIYKAAGDEKESAKLSALAKKINPTLSAHAL
jgi:tetratricopeptide (TPR) repeat protein